MTSIAIHELGHCYLFEEGLGETESPQANRELEIMAITRGRDEMPPHLVPDHYDLHREFFLGSYLEEGWTEEKCRFEWRRFQPLLNQRMALVGPDGRPS